MKITYSSRKLEKTMIDERALRKNYGILAETLHRRLVDLAALDNLAQAFTAGGRFEALVGNREGEYSMRLSANQRLILEIANWPVPIKADGGIDFARIDALRILGVENYH